MDDGCMVQQRTTLSKLQKQEVYPAPFFSLPARQYVIYFENSYCLGLFGIVVLYLVGAGILAIPAVTQEAGFLASAVAVILCWIFMVVTGLLIAEVNVNTMCELGSGGVSLVSMAMRTIGTVGVQIASWSYIFIHYTLLVAYVARSSDILTNFLGIPLWESATLFSLILGGLCYFGSQRFIGAVNGALVVGIIISFTALVPSHITLPNAIEVKIELKSLVAWQLQQFYQTGSISGLEMSSGQIVDPIQQLRSSNGAVGPIIDVFSFLAIATSYIGFILGLSDFLADLLKLPSGQSSPQPYLLTLIPPLVLSLLDPEIFFKALDFAGTYGVLVLFGILPAVMSWSDRYSSSSPSMTIPRIVPGGKLTLSLVIGGAGYIILSEILEKFGLP
ncbi:hypothetical protein KPL71_003375 [Citrus sinensis]|uniref:Uncharacterized protein n=1 Tax=Citrus sinensis TaxID=2711 RepID=A0ACB8MXP5_CITSI|nr:hypothetical protein KPL71_003375 [Citrus sinensis]